MTSPGLSERAPPVPLLHARPGQRVRVVEIDAGQDLRARLCSMGLTIGMAVEVIAVSDGPVILSVLGSRLVVGHGMATRILVRQVPRGAAP